MANIAVRRWRIVATVAVLCALAPSTTAGALQVNPRVLPPVAHPFGKTYGEWGARWWQWALGGNADDNPVLDPTGANCGVGQSGRVWFLAGTFGGPAERACTVPIGEALFFPLVNQAFIATEPGETAETAHAAVTAVIDAVDTSSLFATVDGASVSGLASYRAPSPTFSVTLAEDNVFGLPAGVYGPAAADGFYLMLAPFQRGPHTVHFGGEFGDGTPVDVTYHLTVSL